MTLHHRHLTFGVVAIVIGLLAATVAIAQDSSLLDGPIKRIYDETTRLRGITRLRFIGSGVTADYDPDDPSRARVTISGGVQTVSAGDGLVDTGTADDPVIEAQACDTTIDMAADCFGVSASFISSVVPTTRAVTYGNGGTTTPVDGVLDEDVALNTGAGTCITVDTSAVNVDVSSACAPTWAGAHVFSASAVGLTVNNAQAFADNGLQTAPASTVLRLQNDALAGFQAVWSRDANQYGVLVPVWGARELSYFPVSGNTTQDTGEYQGANITTMGTQSTPAASGTTYQLATPRKKYVSGTGTNLYCGVCGDATAGCLSEDLLFIRGSAANVGGFLCTFVWSAETNTVGTSGFVGVSGSGAPATDPLTRNHSLGMAHQTTGGIGGGTGDNWHFVSRDGATSNSVDLGSNCVRDTTSVYQLTIYCPSNASFCGYRAYNLTTDALCGENNNYTTNLPGATTHLSWDAYLNVLVSVLAQTLNVYSMHCVQGVGVR